MTNRIVTVADTYFNELLNVPAGVNKQLARKIKILQQDPVSARGDAKKLKDHDNVYRVRIGDYRLLYSFGQDWVKLLSIRKRDERTYQLEISQDTPNPIPDTPDLPEDFHYPDSKSRPDSPPPPDSPTLPISFTPSILKKWQIPEPYWQILKETRTEDKLLSLDLPDRIFTRIIDNLYPRPIEEIQAQPEYIIREVEDLDRFFEGEITAFLLKLDPEQEKYCKGRNQGPTLVKGGPGTGKSTIALHRIKYLVDRGCRSILFTTYTNALVKYSEQLLRQLLNAPPHQSGVKIATVDNIIYEVYTARYGEAQLADNKQCLQLLKQAIATVTFPAANVFEGKVQAEKLKKLQPAYLLEEFNDIIEAWGIDSLEEYTAFSRAGRGQSLNAAARKIVWAVYRRWWELLQREGLITWEKLRGKALALVQQPGYIPPYETIIIDEAQDLSPVALRFLLYQISSPAGIYLTADGSQSLYQKGFSWKQIHADLKFTGKVSILKRNYRNTKQIGLACSQILAGTGAGDKDCIEQLPSHHEGDIPLLWTGKDEREEIDRLKSFFIESAKRYRLPLHGAALLCPANWIAKRYAKKLAESGLKAEYVSSRQIDLHAPYIKVMTLHSAKGLEFPFVAVGLSGADFPTIDQHTPADEIEFATDSQRRLLYVGCSRAMRSLIVSQSGNSISPFFNSLNSPHWQKL